MNEGWLSDEYVNLFSEEESVSYSARCKFESLLPGFALVGLRGWDEFIVLDREGEMYSLPTVPVLASNLTPFTLPSAPFLVLDARFTGKIKWYVMPLCFGGDVSAPENMTWLKPEDHAQLVAWWNEQYRALVEER